MLELLMLVPSMLELLIAGTSEAETPEIGAINTGAVEAEALVSHATVSDKNNLGGAYNCVTYANTASCGSAFSNQLQ